MRTKVSLQPKAEACANVRFKKQHMHKLMMLSTLLKFMPSPFNAPACCAAAAAAARRIQPNSKVLCHTGAEMRQTV
jgi:hypothetical protein